MPKTPNLDAQVDGPQYLGPATFQKVRMLSEPEELDESRPDVAIVGAPWDDGTTYRPGARFGPRAVRVANYQPPSWHLDLEVAPFDVLQVIDYGDAVCYPGLTDQAHEAIRTRVAEVASRKIVPIVIGGDHSITYPSATAVADARGRGKVGLVHFDAHADTGKSTWGNLASHALDFESVGGLRVRRGRSAQRHRRLALTPPEAVPERGPHATLCPWLARWRDGAARRTLARRSCRGGGPR